MALYLWQIIAIAFFCVSVTLLIVWLLIQRSKHGRAAALRASEERYLLALAGSTDGLWDWDLLSGSVFYSDRYREILGYSTEEFGGTIDSFRSRLHPEKPKPSGLLSDSILKIVFHTKLNSTCIQNPAITFGSWRVVRQSGTLREKLSGCPALFRTLPSASGLSLISRLSFPK